VPRPHYYLRRAGEELRIAPADRGAAVDLGDGAAWQRAMAARGAVQDTLREGLFAVPCGPTFFQGYQASTAGAALDLALIDGAHLPELPAEGSASLQPWAWAAFGLAVAAAGGASAAGILAEQSFDRFRGKLHDEGLADAGLMAEIDDRRLATNVLASVAAASAAAGVVLLILDSTTSVGPPTASGPAVSVVPALGPGGGAVLLRFGVPWEPWRLP